MRALLSTFAAVLLLAACGQETSEPSSPAPSAPAEQPKSPALVGPILITFNETGAGEINGQTRLNVRSISDVFPDATVARASEGEANAKVITVRRPDGLILDIRGGLDPERVGRIIGRGGPVTGPMGEEIGADWQAAGFSSTECRRGQDDMSHTLICHRPGAPLLGYVFDLPGFEGPDDLIPEDEVLEQSARLSAFVWIAEAI